MVVGTAVKSTSRSVDGPGVGSAVTLNLNACPSVIRMTLPYDGSICTATRSSSTTATDADRSAVELVSV